MYALTHNDDGKGNYQSHTISAKQIDVDCEDVSFNIYGYGETKEEALISFIQEFKKIAGNIYGFACGLEYSKYLMVEVDCCGDLIDEKR